MSNEAQLSATYNPNPSMHPQPSNPLPSLLPRHQPPMLPPPLSCCCTVNPCCAVGADPNYEFKKKKKPLFVHACWSGHAQIVQYLVSETECNVHATVLGHHDMQSVWHPDCTGVLACFYRMLTLQCIVGWDVAIYEGQLAVHNLLQSMADAGQVFDIDYADR